MSDTTRIKTSNYAHIVDRLMPSGGFRSKSDAILTFHRARTLKRLSRSRFGRAWRHGGVVSWRLWGSLLPDPHRNSERKRRRQSRDLVPHNIGQPANRGHSDKADKTALGCVIHSKNSNDDQQASPSEDMLDRSNTAAAAPLVRKICSIDCHAAIISGEAAAFVE
jgi:hypothetical protein